MGDSFVFVAAETYMSQEPFQLASAYANDVILSGLLIADRIQSFCSNILRENKLTEMDLYAYPNLILKVEMKWMLI